jgi:hypothetical protein
MPDVDESSGMYPALARTPPSRQQARSEKVTGCRSREPHAQRPGVSATRSRADKHPGQTDEARDDQHRTPRQNNVVPAVAIAHGSARRARVDSSSRRTDRPLCGQVSVLGVVALCVLEPAVGVIHWDGAGARSGTRFGARLPS